MKQSHIVIIWVIVLCLTFCACETVDYEQDGSLQVGSIENEGNSSSEFSDVSLQIEEENMGYDLAWIERAGPTLRVYVAVDFDRNIQTEMYVHNHKGGGYTYTDRVHTTNISGNIEQGWQENFQSIDTHIYYDCSVDDETGKKTINEYDYQRRLVETHGATKVENVIEKLKDALGDMDLKSISKVLRPNES